MIGIVIPTMNRSDFLIRQLTYYADIGYRHTIYIGDSSKTDHVERVLDTVRRLQDRVKIAHVKLPGLNDSQAMSELLHLVREPYTAFIGDDDFLIPASLEKCARFLDTHPDFSSAHGVATLCTLGSPGAYGEVTSCGRYEQRAVEHASAKQRLIDYLGNYFVTLFSVHRTQDFRREMDAAKPMPDKAFRELLPCCLSIIQGKAKELECLCLIRQAHEQRYLMPDVYDWITSPDWLLSYEVFRDCLAKQLARQDGIGVDEAREVVKQAFWSYLAKALMKQYQGRYDQDGRKSFSRWRKAARRVPGLRSLWRKFRSLAPGKEMLPALLRPSFPYHADFMPIYRAITTLPSDLPGNTGSQPC